jgi:hypothetical protein
MRGVRIAEVAMTLAVCTLNFAALPAHAQTTFVIVPSLCGTAVNLMQCTIDLSPATPLGVYPTLKMSDDLINNTGGLVDWSSTMGPAGRYLGGGVIQQDSKGNYMSYPIWSQVCSNGSCSRQATTLTVYFTGTYIGGGTYAGYYTLQMSYKYQYSYRQGWKWIRTVTGASVTLTK